MPERRNDICGNYDVTFLETGVGNSPVPVVSGNLTIDFEIEVTKVTDTQVLLSLAQINTSNGQSTRSEAGLNFDLTESTEGTIDFSVNGNKAAVHQNRTLRFSSSLQGTPITYVCSQQ